MKQLLNRMALLALIWVIILNAGLMAQRRGGGPGPGFVPYGASQPPVQNPGQPQVQNPAQANDRAGRQRIRIDNGLITIDVVNSPIHTVLKEIAERTGIIFEVRSQENAPISKHLTKVSIEYAIKRITENYSTIFSYTMESKPERIKMVRVIPRKTTIAQPGIIYLGTGVITKTRNEIETPEEALQVLNENASITEKQKGISILVEAKTDPAVKALANCISDPAPEIRISSIEGLATMGSRAALPDILKGLKDSHAGVRQSAITAVAMLGDASNLKDLKPLHFDKDAGVAAAADMAIRKLSITGNK